MKKMFTFEELHKQAYEMYQLFWMLSHGYNLSDLLTELNNQVKEFEDANITPEIAFLEFEDTGFSGELWACFDEFMECEYHDKEFMEMLLGLSPIKEIWLPLYHNHMGSYTITGDAVEKFAEYEKCDEQGLLAFLPCKPGDTIFLLTGLDGAHITETKVLWFEMHPNGIIAYTESHGDVVLKKIFKTKEEAEMAAKKKLNFIDCVWLIDSLIKQGSLQADPDNKDNIIIYWSGDELNPEGWYSRNIHDVARELLDDEESQAYLKSILAEKQIKN